MQSNLIKKLGSRGWLLLPLIVSVLPIAQAQELPTLEPNEQTRPAPGSTDWAPVDRVNPKQAVAIQVVNQTDLAIEYALTTNEASPRFLEPGEQGQIGKAPIPTYMLINPARSQAARFKFDIAVDDQNQVTVTVRRLDQLPPGTSPADVATGATTFNIQGTGAIYVY